MCAPVKTKPAPTTRKAARKAREPAIAEVEVISPPGYAAEPGGVGTAGLITINGRSYGLVPLGGDSRQGFRLYRCPTRKDPECKCYDIDTETGYPRCDCPDFEHRCGTASREFCKHGLALIRLRKLGVI